MDKCPMCGSDSTERIIDGELLYACRSTRYMIPNGTFFQSSECALRVELIHYKASLTAATKRVEELEAEQDRAYGMLEHLGVTRERAKTVWNGIDVLSTRCRKESSGLEMDKRLLESDLAAARSEIERMRKSWSEE